MLNRRLLPGPRKADHRKNSRTHFGAITVAHSFLDVVSKSDVSLLFRFKLLMGQ